MSERRRDLVERLERELRQANHEKHMNAAKVLSRDSLIGQLSETQLAKDVAAAEEEVERLRERCGRMEALLTDVLAILPPELARRVEAKMPAINPDARKV